MLDSLALSRLSFSLPLFSCFLDFVGKSTREDEKRGRGRQDGASGGSEREREREREEKREREKRERETASASTWRAWTKDWQACRCQAGRVVKKTVVAL